jgi:nucleotide-binding universal stress UspA family protein
MSRVIAAIDNSATAQAVLQVATATAVFFKAELEVVHVNESTAGIETKTSTDVVVRMLDGPALDTLLAIGEEIDVQAVVIGARSDSLPPSHGRGQRPVGHVARGLILALKTPIVVVPPHTPLPYSIGRILVPLDGTKEAAAALQTTIELAHDANADVIPLHVLQEDSLPLFNDQPQHEADAWRREFLYRYFPHPEMQRLETRVGVASERVLDVAKDENVDLIALSWTQNPALGRAVIVHETLERSNVPVLLLPVEKAQ